MWQAKYTFNENNSYCFSLFKNNLNYFVKPTKNIFSLWIFRLKEVFHKWMSFLLRMKGHSKIQIQLSKRSL